MTPANGMNIWTVSITPEMKKKLKSIIYKGNGKDKAYLSCCCNLPVVISVIPVIKMNQKSDAYFVCYCGNTDERRIHAVDCL